MLNVPRLRYWFAFAAIFVLIVVAGFYFYARYHFFKVVKDVPARLGIEIQQSTETFSLSKSEGGRTLFTIRASKAVQYKQGGRAELHNVNIVVYGRESNRFDQIYGDDFEYDQQSGNVVAKGVVHIDLEANPGTDVHPELGPPQELKNPIHLKTSGLVFNQKSGIAQTSEIVEFSIPQASGSARGAYYDSKAGSLTLSSDIKIDATGPKPMTLVAHHGVITRYLRRTVLDNARIDQAGDVMSTGKATLFLRDDNTLDHILAEGGVETSTNGETSLTTHSSRAEFLMDAKNHLRTAVMTGGVTFDSTGANQINGNAGRLVGDFGSDAKLAKVRASEGVRVLQEPPSPKTRSKVAPQVVLAKNQGRATVNPSSDKVELAAPAIDFYVKVDASWIGRRPKASARSR